MQFDVRAAEHADIAALIAAYEWLFAPPGSQPAAWDPTRAAVALAQAIESHDCCVLLAELPADPSIPGGGAEEMGGTSGVPRGTLLGFCTAYEDLHSVRFGYRVWVEDLAVDPQQRSQGIGKALLGAARDWARERGATHLELDSGEARKDAHRFYEREGAAHRSISFGWEL